MTITLSKNVMMAIGVILAIILVVLPLIAVTHDPTEGKYVDKSGFSCPYLKAGADDAQTQQDYEDLC